MTINEEIQTKTPEELKDTWRELWEFARDIILWNKGDCEFDEFYKKGQAYFDVQIKTRET